MFKKRIAFKLTAGFVVIVLVSMITIGIFFIQMFRQYAFDHPRGSLEAMVDGTVENSEDIERYHQRMLSETRVLERLVGDLLELSRLQSGKITMNNDRIHIPSLLADAVKSLQTIAEKKGIKIEYLSDQNMPPFLGDYDRLRQLFVIFLDNAVKYSPKNTKVSVETCFNEFNTLSVIIRDQGYGIAAEELTHI